MKKRYLSLLLYFLLSASQAAEINPFTLQAVFRLDNGAPVNVSVDIKPGTKETVSLDTSYALEITVPSGTSDTITLLLLQRHGETWFPQHTLRQPVRDNSIPRIGYQVCSGTVTVHMPAGDTLPDCP